MTDHLMNQVAETAGIERIDETPEQHLATAKRFGYSPDPWAVEIQELQGKIQFLLDRYVPSNTDGKFAFPDGDVWDYKGVSE